MTDFTLVENDERSEINLQELRAKHALQYEREKTALKYYLIGRNFSKLSDLLNVSNFVSRKKNDSVRTKLLPVFIINFALPCQSLNFVI